MKSLFFLILFYTVSSFAQRNTPKKMQSQEHSLLYEVLLQREDVIWGFDFLNKNQIIFTERRSGKMWIWEGQSRKLSNLSGVPAVWAQGQGGLLDVRVHPAQKNKIFWTFSQPKEKGATTALASADIEGNTLKNVKILFAAHEANTNDIHFGSRIEIDGKGFVYMTVGDRNERKNVQDLSYHNGKVIRLHEDGRVPVDNPFIKTENAKPEIWAYGIRSPQGLSLHPVTSELWLAEMGPRGGDEINIIKKGANYGWPVVTHGREYWGPRIGEGTEKKGVEPSVVHWVPSISPSAMTFYTGSQFGKWKNNVFLANLSGMHLRRLVIKDNKVTHQEELLKSEGLRFRNVRTGPEGALYVSTDDGKIIRLSAP